MCTIIPMQGALIAFLYCFLTSEVHAEIKKFIRSWKWRTDLPSFFRKKRMPSATNSSSYSAQSTQIMCTSPIPSNNSDAMQKKTGKVSLNSRRSSNNSRASNKSCIYEMRHLPQSYNEHKINSIGNGAPTGGLEKKSNLPPESSEELKLLLSRKDDVQIITNI